MKAAFWLTSSFQLMPFLSCSGCAWKKGCSLTCKHQFRPQLDSFLQAGPGSNLPLDLPNLTWTIDSQQCQSLLSTTASLMFCQHGQPILNYASHRWAQLHHSSPVNVDNQTSTMPVTIRQAQVHHSSPVDMNNHFPRMPDTRWAQLHR